MSEEQALFFVRATNFSFYRPSENVINAGPSQGSIVQLAHLQQKEYFCSTLSYQNSLVSKCHL